MQIIKKLFKFLLSINFLDQQAQVQRSIESSPYFCVCACLELNDPVKKNRETTRNNNGQNTMNQKRERKRKKIGNKRKNPEESSSSTSTTTTTRQTNQE